MLTFRGSEMVQSLCRDLLLQQNRRKLITFIFKHSAPLRGITRLKHQIIYCGVRGQKTVGSTGESEEKTWWALNRDSAISKQVWRLVAMVVAFITQTLWRCRGSPPRWFHRSTLWQRTPGCTVCRTTPVHTLGTLCYSSTHSLSETAVYKQINGINTCCVSSSNTN